MKKPNIRVRYAPSPTGFLHIGNARTALFNYLFAQHYKGTNILRIENTDKERNITGSIESQYNNMEWLGIVFDESYLKPGKTGPYQQLERLDIYQGHAQKLMDEGNAYRCFCKKSDLDKMRKKQFVNKNRFFKYPRKCAMLTPEQVAKKLAAGHPFCIRLKVPTNHTYRFVDMVRGVVTFESEDLSDWIIVKSNGIPTYNFAVAIDDHLMKITHVIRGEEHLSNTPNQLMLYDYIGAEWPQFAHLTLIVNEDRQKLSKRDDTNNFFISQFQLQGYLPQALFNYLALLGWSPPFEDEVFSKDQLIEMFDPGRWSKSSSMFDLKKLQWMNNFYIKQLSTADYVNLVRPFLEKKIVENEKSDEWVETLTLGYQKELLYGKQIIELTDYFWTEVQPILPEVQECWKIYNLKLEQLSEFSRALADITKWNPKNCLEVIKNFGTNNNLKGKDLYMPLRLAFTLSVKGLNLAITIYLLGLKKCIENVKRFIDVISQ